MPITDDIAKVESWKQAEDIWPPEAGTADAGTLVELPVLTCPLPPAWSYPQPAMLLGTLGDARFRPLEPIRVSIGVEGSEYVAEAVDFDEFGFGSTPREAVRDLQRALVELYFTLEQEQDRLGPDLGKLWASLAIKLARTK